MTQRERSEKALTTFLAEHAAGPVQYTPEWYRTARETLGGSQIAAAMGKNPYSSFDEVVETMLGLKPWTSSVPCQWGSLFEDVAARVIELDCQITIRGDSACIISKDRRRRYSPDGYGVVGFCRDARGELRVWTRDCGLEVEFWALVLFELKSAFRRMPDGKIVPYYDPQVQTGLVDTPIAALGMFVDAVFRKCAFDALGQNSEFDTTYHSGTQWDRAPFAWGVIAVYAPCGRAPREVRVYTDGHDLVQDAALDAARLRRRYMGSGANEGDAIDLGDCDSKVFEGALALIDAKRFPVLRLDPLFGRAGEPDNAALLEAARAGAPEHYHLLGLIPWKLFELHYVPVERKPGFMNDLEDVTDKVHDCVAAARASGDPVAYMRARRRVSAAEARAATRDTALEDAIFDSLSAPD